MAHLAPFFDHPLFRRIRSFTVPLGIFHHRQQAFNARPSVRMAIQTFEQNGVAVSREHRGLLGGISRSRRNYAACITLNHTRTRASAGDTGWYVLS